MNKTGWLLVLALALIPARSRAQLETMADGNSQANVFLNLPSGVENWLVEGQNLLQQEWFWYRVRPSDSPRTIDRLSAPTYTYAGNMLSDTYANAQFSIQAVFTLAGGRRAAAFPVSTSRSLLRI